MGSVKKFTLKDVRCFKGEQSLDIRPITLLVGENSTGKSSVLGCYQTLNKFFADEVLNFNVAPYQMGAFDNIARKSGGRSNQIKEFRLGIEHDYEGEIISYNIVFRESGAEPIVHKINLVFESGGEITLIANGQEPSRPHSFPIIENTNQSNNFTIYTHKELNSPVNVFIPLLLGDRDKKNKAVHKLCKFLKTKQFTKTSPFSDNDIYFVQYSFFLLMKNIENIMNMAPVRSEPQRTYDPTTEMVTPDGGDIPMYMMRLARAEENKWDSLHEKLVEFGKSSGMFGDISIRKFGKAMGDPFQVNIKVGSHNTNIMDVGYGVSQLLPILVRMITENEKEGHARFLLQQPEVHLHPQAQAALASLFVDFAKDGKGQNYLIETHSDYIVNRIRMEIRDGKISPDNVSLVYHEVKKGYVKIYNIEFDEMGNLLRAPEGFRKFFMEETDRFLGF